MPTRYRHRSGTAAAIALAPLLDEFFPEGPPVRLSFWDGSAVGPDNPVGAARVTSPMALRRLLWAPGELGLGRAYVSGDLEVDGDLIGVLDLLEHAGDGHRLSRRSIATALRAARRAGALGGPPAPPPEESRPHGRRHTIRRDSKVVRHHYDVGNEFYEMVLGPSMTYSCARFTTPTMHLEDAQRAKFDLVCAKLGLREASRTRLLDVGCGWGSLLIHAARHYDVHAVGVSISPEQVDYARARVREAGLADRVEVRLQDYRELDDGPFDAISSIGMFEHVGATRMGEYFELLRRHLRPTGRLLNHAISSVGTTRLGRNSFIGRYVFPDGELIDVGQVVLAMERAGFEVRDVESLREHYAATLSAWVSNLEHHWDDAVREVGIRRARVWRLYMAAAAVGFADGGISVHQTLGVLDAADGSSGMPPTRAGAV